MRDAPPRLAERLLTWSLAPDERAAVLGDLAEEFSERADWTGEPAARRWYWHQALTSIAPNALRRFEQDSRRRGLTPAGSAALLLLWLMFAVQLVAGPLIPRSAVFQLVQGLAVVLLLWGAFRQNRSRMRGSFFAVTFLLVLALFLIRGLDQTPAHRRLITDILRPIFLVWYAGTLWPWWPKETTESGARS
jgi:hypothetical protein